MPDIEEVYEEAVRELAKARDEAMTAQKRALQLEQEVRVLRQVLERIGEPHVTLTVEDVPSAAMNWPEMTRRAAILKVLGDAPEPLSPALILRRLKDRGRTQDAAGDISATLAGLKKAGKVDRIGYGAWVLPGGSFPDEANAHEEVASS